MGRGNAVANDKEDAVPSTIEDLRKAIADPSKRDALRRRYAHMATPAPERVNDVTLDDNPGCRKEAIFNSW